jgi:hypothetical protein
MRLPDVKAIKSDYLFGIPLTDEDLNEYPDTAIEGHIEKAIAWMEHELQIAIRPTQVLDEHHDYDIGDYTQFCYLQVYQFPVLSVDRLVAAYAGQDIMTFPLDWVHVYKESGQLQLIPTNGSLSQVLLGQGSGSLLPLITNRLASMPHLFRVDYTTGFAANAVPADISDLIAKKACINIMNILGDILLGAGIASQSVSLDGLSESVSTTQSAENNAYSARVRMYEQEIKKYLPQLRSHYKGLRLAVA